MDIEQVLEALAKVQKGVRISDPEMKIQEVYTAGGAQNLNVPCFMNGWVLSRGRFGPNGLRTLEYTILVQMFIADSAVERGLRSKLCARFEDAWLRELQANVNLDDFGGTLKNEIRAPGQAGDSPSNPQRFEWNGNGYVGCGYELDVTIYDNGLAGP